MLSGQNIKLDEKKLFKSIETTQFDVLKKTEIDSGFEESIKINDENKSFFFWDLKISGKKITEIISKVEKESKDDLNYFNY